MMRCEMSAFIFLINDHNNYNANKSSCLIQTPSFVILWHPSLPAMLCLTMHILLVPFLKAHVILTISSLLLITQGGKTSLFDSIMFCSCCLTQHNSTHFTSKVLFETIQEAKILLFRHCPFNQSKFLNLFNANIRLIKTEKANNSWRYNGDGLSNLIGLCNID